MRLVDLPEAGAEACAVIVRASALYAVPVVSASGPSIDTLLLSTRPFAADGTPARIMSTSWTLSDVPLHWNSTTISPVLVSVAAPFAAMDIIVPLAIEYVGATP